MKTGTYMWIPLRNSEVADLVEQYRDTMQIPVQSPDQMFGDMDADALPDHLVLPASEPLENEHIRVFQLEKRGWFRQREEKHVFFSYTRGMDPSFALTVFHDPDRLYFDESGLCNRHFAKYFRRFLRKQGVSFKDCYGAKFNVRKKDVSKEMLEQRLHRLIHRLTGLTESSKH